MQKAFDTNAEFAGQTLLAYVSTQPTTIKKHLLKILHQLGIDTNDPVAWYKLEAAIQFYARVRKDFGPNTVFNLGFIFLTFNIYFTTL